MGSRLENVRKCLAVAEYISQLESKVDNTEERTNAGES